MKLYQVTAHYSRPAGKGWTETNGVPTFYLRDDMQGIVNEEHAAQVARNMLTALAPTATFHIAIAVSYDFEPFLIGA